MPSTTLKRSTFAATLALLTLPLVKVTAPARQRELPTAQVSVDTGTAGCTVQLDADPSVKSDAQIFARSFQSQAWSHPITVNPNSPPVRSASLQSREAD